MNTRDRSVIKALLQKMTDGLLVDTPEFRAAICHFNIGTTYQCVIPGRRNGPDFYGVDAFCRDSLEHNSHGQRSTFRTQEEADAYAESIRAIGDDACPPVTLHLVTKE